MGIPIYTATDQGVNALDSCSGTWEDMSADMYGNWSSANTGIATVDYYGTHTGQAVGSTTSSTGGQLQKASLKTYCPLAYFGSSGVANVVAATISQKTTGYVDNDNAGKPTYQSTLGTTNLGPVLPSSGGCGLGFEMIGTLAPSVYTGYVILHRYRISRADYTNSTSDGTYGGKDDTSGPSLRDDDPQSGGSNGKVYDLDAPGYSYVSNDGNIFRSRWNFYAYATLSDGITQISPNYYFYVRLSCKNTGLGFAFVNDVPGDNQIGPGTTPLTWNLQ